MFGTPLEKIEFTDIDAFCRSGVREGILLDFKKDFPSRLDKAIAAFANTYGGIILIGVDETPTGQAVLPICGIPLAPGLRERVVQIGINAIYPPVIPEVKVVEFESKKSLAKDNRAVVIVRVHESDASSHAVDKRTTVYLRVDNVSDPYRKATVDEVEWFSNKREKALGEKNRIIGIAQSHAQHYLGKLRTRHQLPTSHPAARFAFWTVPTFPRKPIAPPQELLRVCPALAFHLPAHSHPFPLGSVHPVTEGIYFDGNYSTDYRYTEIQQQGLVYHEYGFWWDDEDRYRSWVFPNAIAELMLVALQFGTSIYERTGYWGLLDFEFRLAGVRDRRIGSPNPLFLGEYKAVDDILAVRTRDSGLSLRDNMFEVAKSLYKEILWSFGWDAGPDVIDKHFSKLTLQRVFPDC